MWCTHRRKCSRCLDACHDVFMHQPSTNEPPPRTNCWAACRTSYNDWNAKYLYDFVSWIARLNVRCLLLSKQSLHLSIDFLQQLMICSNSLIQPFDLLQDGVHSYLLFAKTTLQGSFNIKILKSCEQYWTEQTRNEMVGSAESFESRTMVQQTCSWKLP